jgi:hypothetical protein
MSTPPLNTSTANDTMDTSYKVSEYTMITEREAQIYSSSNKIEEGTLLSSRTFSLERFVLVSPSREIERLATLFLSTSRQLDPIDRTLQVNDMSAQKCTEYVPIDALARCCKSENFSNLQFVQHSYDWRSQERHILRINPKDSSPHPVSTLSN